MDLVETVIEDARWEAFGLGPLAERAGRAALAGWACRSAGFMISLMGCDDARIAVLNADFRGKPQPTNVLSWPSEERGAEFVGEAPEPPEPGEADDPESWATSPSPGRPARARPRSRASRWPTM
jgi:probable rRNA maturation factor